MQQPLQITFHEMAPSAAVERRIREKVADLEKVCDGITRCRVSVEFDHQRHRKGNMFAVHMNLHVPGKEIVVGHQGRFDHAHEDVYVAVRDTFAAASRQLADYVRKRRGFVKHHDTPSHGRVNKLYTYERYGFVEMPDGTDVYFHENAVVGNGFDALTLGADVRVVLAEQESEHGPQASTVTPIGKHHIANGDSFGA